MIQSLQPIYSKKCYTLILGTMPGVKSLELQQYYAHPRNNFWKIMFTIFDESFSSDYNSRKKLLLKHNIALWDVLEYCNRKNSADSNITNGHPNDITKLIEETNIKKIFFNGGTAESLYNKYFSRNTNIKYYTLPSTSPAHTISFNKKLEKWRVIS
jgi:hypoxanthine-DNA glycosylase